MHYGRYTYDPDKTRWPADAYGVDGSAGVAWRVLGWETEPGPDTHWDGDNVRTGRALCVMVGDDRPEAIDPDDLTPLDDLAYCHVCGQMGCAHDGLER